MSGIGHFLGAHEAESGCHPYTMNLVYVQHWNNPSITMVEFNCGTCNKTLHVERKGEVVRRDGL